MGKMFVCRTTCGAVFVPCDTHGKPDFSRVPSEYQSNLQNQNWKEYTVTTSVDMSIFAVVSQNGYSVQKTVVKFEEKL